MYSVFVSAIEREKNRSEIIIQISKDEIQQLAMEQFGRPLSEYELEALDDLSPIGLHDWIGLAIEAAKVEPSPD